MCDSEAAITLESQVASKCVRKSYGQFCGAARALDRIGDRWSLLIVRELLLRDASYGDLTAALAGIPSNLLAARLRDLEGDGLVERLDDPDDRRRGRYRLTPLGVALEPVLLELIKWGAHWMASGPGDDRFDPRWTSLALRALLNGRHAGRSGSAFIDLGEELMLVTSDGGPITVQRISEHTDADCFVEGDGQLLLGVASAQRTLANAIRSGVRVSGDRGIAKALLTPVG